MQQSTKEAGRRSPIMEIDGAEQEGGRSRKGGKRKGNRRGEVIKIPPREMRFSMWGLVCRGKEKSFFALPPPAPVAAAAAAAAATPPRSHHAQRVPPPPRSWAASAALKAVTVPVTACKEGEGGIKKWSRNDLGEKGRGLGSVPSGGGGARKPPTPSSSDFG